MKKSTQDLMNELQQKGVSLQDYLDQNEDAMVLLDIREFWNRLIQKSNRSKSDIINKSDFSYCYFYDVIKGKKIPSRDKIIRLILAMGANMEDCQEAMKISGKSPLYPRIRRDSILIYAIENSCTAFQLSELLNRYGEGELK